MELLIKPGHAEKNYWRDLWRYRELFYFLAWRDLLVRYKQTVIGIGWAVIRPFLTTVIFTVFASKLAGLRAPDSIPYALLVLAAMLPWQFFATAMSEASNSLIGNANLISKIYFPRLIVPASSVITSFVDFLITLGLLAGFMIWYRFGPDWHLLALPLFMAIALGASFGTGLWMCALNVEYRDFRYVVPFVIQFGMLVSPVAFSSTQILAKFGEKGLLLFSLNPMVGVIDGFRWALLCGRTELNWSSVLISALLTTALCSSGVWYFRRMEKTFADVI